MMGLGDISRLVYVVIHTAAYVYIIYFQAAFVLNCSRWPCTLPVRVAFVGVISRTLHLIMPCESLPVFSELFTDVQLNITFRHLHF